LDALHTKLACRRSIDGVWVNNSHLTVPTR
jgi:hypothetical protein